MGKGKVRGRGQAMERDMDQLPPHQAVMVPSPSLWGRGRAELGTPEPH